MEILLWLAPSALVAILAMIWVGWWGRDGRGEVDADEAVRRIGVALEKDPPRLRGSSTAARPARVRSNGVAIRHRD